ncbi:MAG: hypothetical protein KDC34_02005 [Saprospiraceae bacterium]|nr:hypothetical protein [Saprospiraceae bacterium]
MGRYSKHPQYVQECLTFSISTLKKFKELSPDVIVYNGVCNWTKSGRRVSSISYRKESISDTEQILTFDFLSNGKPIVYDVKLVAIPSNLGKGVRWYFICPATGKRCTKLIRPYYRSQFFHRTAFGLKYESQCQSKTMRALDIVIGDIFRKDRLYEQLYKKYKKRHYRGKPTPLVRKIKKVENRILDMQFTLEDMKRAIG